MALSEKQVARLWVEAGGPEDQAAMAVAVAKRESGRNPKATNGASGASGLFQIYPAQPGWQDPKKNTEMAVKKFKERGWQPWSVCGTGGAWGAGTKECGPLQAEAKRISRRIGKFDSGGIISGVPDPGDLVDEAKKGAGALGVGGLIKPFVDLVNLLKNALTWITSSEVWTTVGKIIVGQILLLGGAFLIQKAATK